MEEILKKISEQIAQLTRQIEILREIPSTPLALRQLAVEDSARYIWDNFREVNVFKHRHETVRYAVQLASVDGLFLEFGVHTGGTITQAARLRPEKHFYGFDSFEGLPEDWAGTGKLAGDFNLSGNLPNVPENVTLVKGWFDQTIPVWKTTNPGPISYLHVDSDLYSSAVTIFETLEERFVPGTVILFDEYFGYPDWRNGEHKAFVEMINRTGFAYTAKAISHMAFVVQLGEKQTVF